MVNVDTVYQRVLALANKEQRGYITPQEFNLFANQAQMDIFEQYFYDINQRERVPGNKDSYADISTLLEEKVDLFLKVHTVNGHGANDNIFGMPSDYYKLSEVSYKNPDGTYVEVERLTYKQFNLVKISPLTAPTPNRPIYYQKANKIIISPDASHPGFVDDAARIIYLRKPIKVNWTYVIVGDKAMYNSSAADSSHFDLHPSEETKLVIKILALAGITLKDPALYQIAATEDTKSIQQEKQ